MTGYPEIWNALAETFHKSLVRERPAGGGRMVDYITARTAMNRFDMVMGFENWWDTYERDPMGSDNVVCRLSIRLPDGTIVTKCDCGAPGSTGDEHEDDKGAFSDAFKRAAVKFGVGRYLYGDGVWLAPLPSAAPAPTATKALPAPEATSTPRESLPSQARPPVTPQQRSYGEGRSKPSPSRTPSTGSQLFGWLKDADKEHGTDLLKYITGWAKLHDFPTMMKNWDIDMVRDGLDEAQRRLESLTPALAN